MCNWEYCLCLCSTSWHCWESPLSQSASTFHGCVVLVPGIHSQPSCPSPLRLNHDLVKSISPHLHPSPCSWIWLEKTQQSRTSPFRSIAAPQMAPWSCREAMLPYPRPSTGLLSWSSCFVFSLQTTESPSLSSTSAADLACHLAEKTETVWRASTDSHQCVCNYLHLCTSLLSPVTRDGLVMRPAKRLHSCMKPLSRLERPCCCCC